VENDLRKGNLVQPFEQTVDAGDGFYLIYPDRHRLPARVRNFRRWIIGQLAKEREIDPYPWVHPDKAR
jgi:LysR family transcriptional regulator, glycine cleavage system transcriptional activator